ncbi:MAG: DNA gyrase subunit A [Candidatus Izemoplasma sp.]
MQIKSIENYLNNECKEYAKYVVYSRAIPSIMDGLKPSQRKILFTALKVAKNKKVKTKALGGQTIATANFHHGDASLDAASTLMAGDWNNNAQLLQGEGNFGSRIVNEAGAPRYTFVKVHENFDKWFLDREILLPQPDPEDPEPLFYLPIIPWVLVNGIQGIAVGFATNILPRDPIGLKKACISVLNDREPLDKWLTPKYPDFKGTVERVVGLDSKYLIKGCFNKPTPTTVQITEIPYGVEREKYLEGLEKLKDAKKISSYTEQCGKKGFLFTIKLPIKSKNLSDAKLSKLLKLERPITESLTVILENGQLKKFESASDLIKYFIEVRKAFYQKRYEHKIGEATKEKEWLLNKYKFIKKFVDGVATIEKKSRAEIKEVADSVDPKYSTELLNLKVYRFNKDELEAIKKDGRIINKDVQRWSTIDIIEAYEKDLKSIGDK